MKRLFIDTATPMLRVVLSDDEKIIGFHERTGLNDHSRHLAPTIEKLLLHANWTMQDIEAIIVSSGPGSYTGLRIGVTMAKVFAYTLNIPLYEISSLYVLGSHCETVCAVMIDARRSGAFSTILKGNQRLIEEKLRSYEALEQEIKKIDLSMKRITEKDSDFNIINIIQYATLVKDVHQFVPNYLRDTEAERQLKAGMLS